MRYLDGNFLTFEAPNTGPGAGEGPQPSSINAEGTISGDYFDASNVVHGFLLSPSATFIRIELAEQKECRIEEGHLLADHVHLMISILPKYSVSSVVGFIEGAIHLDRVYGEQKQDYAGRSFWTRGYLV